MNAIRLTTSSDCWAILEGDSVPAPASVSQLLEANAGFGSLAKFAHRHGGTVELRSEIPPGPDHQSLLDHAREEMAVVEESPPEYSCGTLEELPVHASEEAVAAARDAGWTPEVRPGGDIHIPFTQIRAHAKFGVINGNSAAYVEALAQLPEVASCREAALAFALSVTKVVRLVRAALIQEEKLVWQVPMTSGFEPVLLDHALNALATIHRTSGMELVALAANTSLASAWTDASKTTETK